MALKEAVVRRYLHSFDGLFPIIKCLARYPQQSIPEGTDTFYEGLHGGVVDGDTHIAKHVDLLIGMVPHTNLEWIQNSFVILVTVVTQEKLSWIPLCVLWMTI